MGFSSLLGQPTVVQTLSRALTGGHVAHAYRFEGPDGVGKELAAQRLAQALVCEREDPLGCETCSACRRAVTFHPETPRVPQHPDVLFVQRGLYPPSLLGSTGSEATGISVDQIRRIVLSRVGFPPHEGRALCIIVRDAHELTLSAANALLKTLEEPAPRTHFILLTSQPRRLLDTIRSRTLAVRFRPLPEQVVGDLLEAKGAPRGVAAFAGGSVSQGLALAEEEVRTTRERFVAAADAALAAPDLAGALPLVDQRPEERDALLHLLSHLAQTYALRARQSIHDATDEAQRLAERYGVVSRAMSDLQKNGQAGLVLESMITRLRRT